MAVKQVTLAGIGAVTLYKRRGNRSLRLSIGADGEVRVSMPHWLPYQAGAQFAVSRAPWIEQHRPKSSGLLQHGHAIGKAHHLYFEASPTAAKVTTRVAGSAIRITHPVQLSRLHESVQQAAQRASLRALKQEAEALLPRRLRDMAAHHGYRFASVQVKQLKSRWGSCSSQQEITLNLFLMQLPWHLIDYVLLHELAHTRVMQHGAPFWQEMAAHLPAAKMLRKEIGLHQPMLVSKALGVA